MAVPRTCPGCQAQSATADYCDNCGTALGASAGGDVRPGVGEASAPDGSVVAGFNCVSCGARRTPDDDFCETCGLDFTNNEMPKPPAPSAPLQTSSWTVMIAPDRDYFNGNQADSAGAIAYPEGLLPREVPLTGDEMTVGRSDEARGSFPDIDLSRPVVDPGVSRRHAVLHRQGDGSWALTDENSANGTWLNDDPESLQSGKLVALHDGDRIQMGAFTVLTLRHHSDGRS